MVVAPLSTLVQRLRSSFVKKDATGATDEFLLESFLSQRDDAAFEALVRRHGSMVLGVCRRILGNHHDAEDAFQATFLVLVRKGASIRPKSMVGNWLYGVACRTALDTRRAAARRRAKEAAVLPRVQMHPDNQAGLQAVIDDELRHLPPRSRAVIVLSDLEGKTRKEVAQQLGWPEGTVASRLARARVRLAKRLARYGLAVAGGSEGTLLSESAALAAVPDWLLASTVKAGSLLAAGESVSGVIPARVAARMEGTLKAMLLNKVLKTTALLLIVAAVGTGTGLVLSQTGKTEKPGETARSPGQESAGANGESPAVDPSKHATKEVDLSKELDKLKGVWVCVGYERDGEEHVDQQAREAMWNETLWFHAGTPKDDPLNISWERKGRQTSALAAITLRPATNLRAIDLSWRSIPAREFMPKGIDPAWEQATWDETKLDRVQPGLYAFEGDQLRLCWGTLGGPRPTSVRTRRGEARAVHLYERKTE